MTGDILYKYRSWTNDRHVDVLTKNEIYFASPAEFNDPFDCRISPDLTLLDTEDKIEEFVHRIVTSGIKNNPTLNYESEKIKFRQRIKTNLLGEIANFKKIHHSIQDESYGIFSLSYFWEKVLLWSHYADNHRGFCIGFDIKNLKTLDEIGMGWPVNYSDEFPRIDPLLDDQFEIAKLEVNTKAKDWEYEGEFRLFTIIGTRMKSRVYKIPDNCFREVIIGLKFPKDKIKTIKEITEAKKIKLYQAIGLDNKFKLDRIEI
jgi:hypothetical protein